MAKKGRSKLLSREDYQARWVAASFSDRRRIMRSVSRGTQAASVSDAQLVVPSARRQQTFWRWAWLMGAVPGLTVLGEGPQVFVANLLMGLFLMGALSVWKFSRAKRAEQANLALLGVVADEDEEPSPGPLAQLRTRFGRGEVPSSGRSEAELLGLEPEKGGPKEKVTALEQQPDLGKPREGIRSPATSAKKAKRRKRRR